MQDHRSVPLEVLRDFVRSQAELTSIRQVATEVGLGRATLHAFIHGETNPHPRVRRVLAQWYIRKLEEAPDIDVIRPYVAALSTLLNSLPSDEQESARALLIADLCGLHGLPLPRWLQLLSGAE
jgi:hypothetical protein